MPPKLLIFETHPIQYRAPVFQAMQLVSPGVFEVVYASDFSVRGYKDEGFGTDLAWDVPLLSGYPSRILHNERTRKAEHWSGLTASGIDRLIGQIRPAAVMLSSLSYAFNWAVYLAALRRGIPIWIRLETQDQAVDRGKFKALLRGLVYKLLYSGVDRAFFIGQLSREHLTKFGVPDCRLTAAHYCTPNPFKAMSIDERWDRRGMLRERLGVATDCKVIAFFGKLIPKKDPMLVLQAVAAAYAALPQPMAILVVGSGELQVAMREEAVMLEQRTGVRAIFTGFINQAQLPDYYLASDIVVLPSRRMGETWGLVINEALQAGCAAIVSDAVGCHRDFGSWARVRVIPVNDAPALGDAIQELSEFPRDLVWADELLGDYSTEAAANAVIQAVASLPQRPVA